MSHQQQSCCAFFCDQKPVGRWCVSAIDTAKIQIFDPNPGRIRALSSWGSTRNTERNATGQEMRGVNIRQDRGGHVLFTIVVMVIAVRLVIGMMVRM